MSSKKQMKKAQRDQQWRGHDVTGALSYVQTLMDPDGWAGMGEAQPKTDREAARLFFEIDRGNHTLGDFLQFLKQHCVDELDRLSKQQRIPPKKLVGFINVATGEQRRAYPDFITLPANNYDALLYLIRWSDACPAGIELGDRTWERIHDQMCDLVPLDEAQWPGVFVDSVQIESVESSQRNICPGTLVVLLSHEDSQGDDTEHHCVLVRGQEE